MAILPAVEIRLVWNSDGLGMFLAVFRGEQWLPKGEIATKYSVE